MIFGTYQGLSGIKKIDSLLNNRLFNVHSNEVHVNAGFSQGPYCMYYVYTAYIPTITRCKNQFLQTIPKFYIQIYIVF